MVKYLIKDTTREEREQIVAESLGNIDASCDGCSSGIVEMYQDYIDGKKELREISMEFNARFLSDEITKERMMAKAGGNLLNTYVADYVVFDLETTGISPKTDEVVEISAVKVEHGKVTDEFSTLVNPKQRIPYGASRVNGITDDMVAEAPFFEQVLEEFLEFIEGFVLVGHNIARFDMNFLYRDVEKYFERSLANDYIDTLQMARRELPNLEHHRLTDLAEYYGISAEGAHRALNDCRMNQQVFEKMGNPVYKKQGKDKENNRGVDSAKTEPSEQAQNTAPTVRKRSTFKLRAVVERITYQNPDNGYTVLKCAVKNYQDLVTVVGSLLDVNVGSVLLIDGNWKMDSRYGRQFQAKTWEETMPATVFGIEKYLGSGLIKGVGPKYAKRIVQKFGTETIAVIEADVFRLRYPKDCRELGKAKRD